MSPSLHVHLTPQLVVLSVDVFGGAELAGDLGFGVVGSELGLGATLEAACSFRRSLSAALFSLADMMGCWPETRYHCTAQPAQGGDQQEISVSGAKLPVWGVRKLQPKQR